MTYNAEGRRTSRENLAGQITTTAWDGWSVTYNGENRPVLWQCVSTNSPTPNSSTPNSSTPPLISMSYDRMGRRVTKNAQRFVYDGYLQIANFELQTLNSKLQTFIWDPTEPVATRPLVWNRFDSVAYYTHDGNKNVSEIVASDGALSAHYEYIPYIQGGTVSYYMSNGDVLKRIDPQREKGVDDLKGGGLPLPNCEYAISPRVVDLKIASEE